jgi:hydrogenase maturation protease
MEPSRGRPRILIAGLGNVLLMDDGVGVHVVREIEKSFSPGVLAVEVGTAVLDGLHLFEWANRILAIDAMKAGGPPGTFYLSRIRDIEESGTQISLHELSLLAAFRFLPDHLRPEVILLGIEPERIDYGHDLSSTLQTRMPQLIQTVKTIAICWKKIPKIRDNSTGSLETLLKPSGILSQAVIVM